MTLAIYPGSFDPVTRGHLDIVFRSSKVFDEVIVAVSGESRRKKYWLSQTERKEHIERCVSGLSNVRVEIFEGLITDWAAKVGGSVLVRGLRAVSDFEYELQMASMNRRLNPEIETVFLTTQTKYSFLSSSSVKEIASYKGDISKFVPPQILDDLVDKYPRLDV
jgi:pantetheine-phosphate adenylyltransferase